MLKLDGITKTYKMASTEVHALKSVSLEFRSNEFVSILGPSGCGKTTLLNIVGGLDRYTEGDLVIDGVSTKEFRDKDWDTYRNHKVGFVFQSYNLIPHQTVLQNVELALTLSGVSREERRQRATAALQKVCLADKLSSRPNQLSGGQMQRVAIARALVNDPEIILADEPTGALDTESSTLVMDILKEVAKDRLVVMVTHNPELAEKYSTRIVRLLDGEVQSDSMPFTQKDAEQEQRAKDEAREKFEARFETQEQMKKAQKESKKRARKRRMSYFTAIALSFKNLLTKKARTSLVAIAGSIGIIGIALILAISSGFSKYINKMQEDTLSNYPITISSSSVDMTSIFSSFLTNNEKTVDHDKDAVYVNDRISKILDMVGGTAKTNNVEKFYAYLQEHYDEIKNNINAVQYTYSIGAEVYNDNDDLIQPNGNTLYNMIVKYSLFRFQDMTKLTLEFEENGCVISANEATPLVEPPQENEAEHNAYENFWKQVSGYIGATKTAKLKADGTVNLSNAEIEDIISGLIGMNLNFTFDSAYEMIDNKELIESQYDLIAGSFDVGEDGALLVLDKNNELDDYMLYALGIISEDQMNTIMQKLIAGEHEDLKFDYNSLVNQKEFKFLVESDYFSLDFLDADGNMGTDEKLDDIRLLLGETYSSDIKVLAIKQILASEYSDSQKIYAISAILGDSNAVGRATYLVEKQKLLDNCQNTIKITGIVRLKSGIDGGSLKTGLAYSSALTKKLVEHYNASDAVQNEKLSPIALDSPESINIYVNTFAAKNKIKAFIDSYNAGVESDDEITYTDTVGLIMSTVSTIINAITYVLIAFVGVSLVVSSIMIGVITYISVIERTKEIGVLRSVGASKRDIRRVFTAESLIIGLASGLFGIVVALLFTIPINIVLKHFTQIGGLAMLPWLGGIVLVLISVVLTLVAGYIPARIAAKKDPVVALRSE